MINKYQLFSIMSFAKNFCAKAKDDKLPMLKGVFLEIDNSHMTLTSTDGQHASLITVPIESDISASAIIRVDDIELLCKMMSCDAKATESVSIEIDDSVTVFKTEHCELITERLAQDESYPDIKKLALRDGKEPTGVPMIAVSPTLLRQAAKTALAISNNGVVMYTWDATSFIKLVVDPKPELDVVTAFILLAPMSIP